MVWNVASIVSETFQRLFIAIQLQQLVIGSTIKYYIDENDHSKFIDTIVTAVLPSLALLLDAFSTRFQDLEYVYRFFNLSFPNLF